MKNRNSVVKQIQRYFFTGILTTIPLLVTWLLVDFLLDMLRSFGEPLVTWISNWIEPWFPVVSSWLTKPWFLALVAVLLVITALIITGWLTTIWIGRRFLVFFDSLVDRVPMVRNIYGSVKKLLEVMQTKPDGVQRVVLIDFPSRDMKTVGLVTRTMVDEVSGRTLAAVYVPTTPNPTSGYLEIVPVENITSTDWSFDEAMSFIISGGAVAPSTLRFENEAEPGDPETEK